MNTRTARKRESVRVRERGGGERERGGGERERVLEL